MSENPYKSPEAEGAKAEAPLPARPDWPEDDAAKRPWRSYLIWLVLIALYAIVLLALLLPTPQTAR